MYTFSKSRYYHYSFDLGYIFLQDLILKNQLSLEQGAKLKDYPFFPVAMGNVENWPRVCTMLRCTFILNQC